MNHIRSKFSRYLTTAISFILLFVLAGSISAEDVLSYVETGITEYASLIPYAEDETEGYSFTSGTSSVSVMGLYKLRRIRDNVVHVIFPDQYPEDDSSPSVSVRFELNSSDAVDTEMYSALMYGIRITGAYDTEYTAEVILESDRGQISSSQTVLSSETWSAVTSESNGLRGAVTAVTVNIYFSSETMPEKAEVTMPSLIKDNPEEFEYANKYCTTKLTASVGRFGMRSSAARPENGTFSAVGRLETHTDISEAEYVYFLIKISGLSGADLSLGVTSDGQWNENARYRTGISIGGDGEYVIPVKKEDGISDFMLSFSGCDCDGSFRIEQISLLTDEGASGVFSRSELLYEGLSGEGEQSGTVTRDGTNVTFRGEIDRNIVKRYHGAVLGFYAISVLTADDISTAVEIGSMDLSNMYDITFNLAQAPTGADVSMFFMAVKTEDSILPFDSPKYADADEAIANAKIAEVGSVISSSGLYGAAPVGSFEANVSNVIVDVDVSMLMGLAERDSAVTVDYTVYRGGDDGEERTSETKRIYLDRDTIEELGDDISFYARAGIDVYIRLLFSSPVDSLTYSGIADYYLPDLSTDDARYAYAAIVRLLAKSYPTAAGFILGEAVNYASCIGDTDEYDNTVLYSSRIADMARITYNAAARYISDVCVVIPQLCGNEECIDASVLGTFIAEKIEEIGDFPWIAMYITENPEDESAIEIRDRLSAFISSLNGDSRDVRYSVPVSAMFMTEGKEEYYSSITAQCETEEEIRILMAQITGAFWERSADEGIKAAFFSLEGTGMHSDHGYYSDLKYAAGNAGSIYEAKAYRSEDEAHIGVYTIWDFSDKNYTLGWLGGGGALSCATEWSEIFSEKYARSSRVLRTVFEAGSGTAGMTLNNLDQTLDGKCLSSIDFTFALESSGDDKPTVVFVIGTYETRAEYYASSLTPGTIYNLSCDLTGFEERGQIDFIGVIVYADGETVLELSSVTAISEEIDSEQLSSLFMPKETETEVKRDYRTAASIFGIAVIVSAAAMILLNGRGDEEDKG